MRDYKLFLSDWVLPPKVLNLIIYHQKSVKWSGAYSSWKEAQALSSGYDDPEILNKILNSALKVIAGEAAFERDSVPFSRPEYNWPVVSIMLWIAAKKNSKLRLLDFGGSLGSQYFQHKIFLDNLAQVSWNIVEQNHFVSAGKKNISDPSLKFYNSITEAEKHSPSDMLLLSCVLPYLEHPHRFLKEVLTYEFEYILVEKNPFFTQDSGSDSVSIQTVREPIYVAQYPAWFFSKNKFMKHFELSYVLVFEYICDAETIAAATYKGMLFRRKISK